MSKKRAIICLVVLGLVLITTWQVIGPHDWLCHRCGASKTRFFVTSVHPTDTTRWLAKMSMGQCDRHYWIVNSRMLGLADHFASWEIPLCDLWVGRRTVESLPNDDWKREILTALADERNTLRWAVLRVMQFDSPFCERSPEEWRVWWEAFSPIFSVEYDHATARKKATRVRQSMEKVYAGKAKWHADAPGMTVDVLLKQPR